MTQDAKERFSRVSRMLGEGFLDRIAAAPIIIFGVGGVGSWCAEALVRSGAGNLTIVDADRVAASNINRQAMATVRTVGRVKVEAMAERLLEVNPGAHVRAMEVRYGADTAGLFNLDEYDYIVDAIDSLGDKALLIENACRSRGRLFSSMGAALKGDPTMVRVAEFWKVEGCPLAAALRRRFRKSGVLPAKRFECVFSPERLGNLGEGDTADSAMSFGKVAYNGALCTVTATFGLTLASLIVDDLRKR